MAWDQPPEIGIDYQDYAFLFQFPKAIQDRGLVENHRNWPGFWSYWSGIVGAITDNGDGTFTVTDNDVAPAPDGEDDDGRYWAGSHRTTCTDMFWVGVQCPSTTPPVPANYDLIIQHVTSGEDALRPNPMRVIRGEIESNTSKTLTITDDLVNHITAGTLDAASSLVGKRYYIIKRNGPAWSDRDNQKSMTLDWPNCEQLWLGEVGTGHLYSETQGFLRDPYNRLSENGTATAPQRWEPDEWAGKEVLVFADDDYLRRLVIVGNDSDTLYFGSEPLASDSSSSVGDDPLYVLEGRYCIIEPGGVAFPDRDGGYVRRFYSGHMNGIYGHDDPTDTLRQFTQAFASTYVTRSEGFTPEVICEEYRPLGGTFDDLTLDRDPYSPEGNYCDDPDKHYAPQLNKTIRSWQVAIEGLCRAPWVSSVTTTTGKPSLPFLTVPRLFHDAGINAGTTTIAGPSGDPARYYFTVPEVYHGHTILYTLTSANEDNLRIGGDLMDASGFAEVGTGRVYVGTQEELEGAGVIYTAGWSRTYPLEIQHVYDAVYFLPDIVEGEDGPMAKDPPAVVCYCGGCGEEELPPDECERDCNGVGTWIKRAKSTHTRAFSDYGYSSIDRELRNGDLVRYVGDGWSDGSHNGWVYDAADNESAQAALRDFHWRGSNECRHRPAAHNRIVEEATGYSTPVQAESAGANAGTYSTTTSLTDTSREWWRNWYDGRQVNYTHTGVADAGSSTTLTTDDTRNDLEDDDSADCWWNLERFPYATYPFEGFIIEIDKTEDVPQVDAGGAPVLDPVTGEPLTVSATVTYKRPITNVVASGTKWVVHFAAIDGFSVEEGDTWRIIEPAWHTNRYRDKRVVITYPDGTSHERTITHSDGNTIYWSDALPTVPPVDTRYEIIELYPGKVYKVTTTAPAPGTRNYQKIGPSMWLVQPVAGSNDTRPNGQPWREDGTENLPGICDPRFGRSCKGDYVWFGVFDEMYRALNKIIWTKMPYGWINKGEINYKDGSFGPFEGDINKPPENFTAADYWATAINGGGPFVCNLGGQWVGVLDLWAGNYTPGTDCVTGGREELTVEGAPSVYVVGGVTQLPPNGSGWSYMSAGAGANSSYFYATLNGIPNLIAHAIDYYAYAETNATGDDPRVEVYGTPGTEDYIHYELRFNPFSTGLTHRRWGLWHTEGAEVTATRETETALGAIIDAPSITTPPTLGSVGQSSTEEGYAVTDAAAVLRWNVAGGLKYVATSGS